MLIENTKRKLVRLNLNSSADLDEYNRILSDPAIKIIDKQVLEEKESHFEQDFSETTTNHIAYLEIEECSI